MSAPSDVVLRTSSEVVLRTSSESVLRTRGLIKRFGGIVATADVDLDVQRGARHALIGPNGAGKTTLINLMTGVLAPTQGRIELEGDDITQLAPHRRVQRGLVRTFQINQLFASLTPIETLAMVVEQQRGRGARWWLPLGAAPKPAGQGDASESTAERCARLIEQFRLQDVAAQRTDELPYGKRRLLEIAIALACEPRVLLLDEPMAGVPAGERDELLLSVSALPADVSVLLIEHDMDLVFEFARHITVLVGGAILTEGTPQDIAADERVRAVYLGHGSAAHVGRPGAGDGGGHGGGGSA